MQYLQMEMLNYNKLFKKYNMFLYLTKLFIKYNHNLKKLYNYIYHQVKNFENN